MENKVSQKSKAEAFKALHHGEKMLVLPNIWDPLGAALLETLGYPAVATASASVALTHGYDDGERIPLQDVLKQLTQIVNGVSVPVTADFESGYADSEQQLERNIELLLQTGIVGINLEDYDKKSGVLFSAEMQCKRIKAVMGTADAMKVPLFINARTDLYMRGKQDQKQKLLDTENRGKAYIDAGADCFFPVAMKNKDELAYLVSSLKCPVNVIAIQGIPDFETLQEIGVARLSLGPGFLKVAIKAMKGLAQKLKNYEGLDEVTNNEVSSEFLKKLVNRT